MALVLAQTGTFVAPPVEPPSSSTPVEDDPELEAFKRDVRTWLELDDSIRRMQAAVRDRRAMRKQLTERVLGFMGRHNIEDLSTREARLRFRVHYVRKPLTHDVIKERIGSHFGGNPATAEAVVATVFANRERQETTSLRRLPILAAQP